MRYGSASTRGRSSGRSLRTVCRPPAPRNVFLAWSTRPATSAGSVETDSVHGGRVKRLGLDGLYVCRAMGGRGDIRPGDSRGRGVIRGVRCGIRQLRMTALLPKGFHEHRRLAMTNSVCNLVEILRGHLGQPRTGTGPRPLGGDDRLQVADEALSHDAASFLLVIIAAATLLFAPPAGAARRPRVVPVTDACSRTRIRMTG